MPKEIVHQVHGTYAMGFGRHSQKKERTQKTTPCLNENQTNQQNKLKTLNFHLCTTEPIRKDY